MNEIRKKTSIPKICDQYNSFTLPIGLIHYIDSNKQYNKIAIIKAEMTLDEVYKKIGIKPSEDNGWGLTLVFNTDSESPMFPKSYVLD